MIAIFFFTAFSQITVFYNTDLESLETANVSDIYLVPSAITHVTNGWIQKHFLRCLTKDRNEIIDHHFDKEEGYWFRHFTGGKAQEKLQEAEKYPSCSATSETKQGDIEKMFKRNDWSFWIQTSIFGLPRIVYDHFCKGDDSAEL